MIDDEIGPGVRISDCSKDGIWFDKQWGCDAYCLNGADAWRTWEGTMWSGTSKAPYWRWYLWSGVLATRCMWGVEVFRLAPEHENDADMLSRVLHNIRLWMMFSRVVYNRWCWWRHMYKWQDDSRLLPDSCKTLWVAAWCTSDRTIWSGLNLSCVGRYDMICDEIYSALHMRQRLW